MTSRKTPERLTTLQTHGISQAGEVFWNLPTPALYEHAVHREEGHVAHHGPFVVRTGHHTGRSPNDKFVVSEPSSHDEIWWGNVNRPIEPDAFDRLHQRQLAYLQDKDLYVQDCYVGADPNYRVPIRVITEAAWHSLFARNMFLRELDPERLRAFQPEFTILDTPHFHAAPKRDGTASETFIMVHFGTKQVLIGGTSYAGEIKKSAFTIMNYLLPRQGVLAMHCSANYGRDKDDAALFFGLSGTGKTTLSASSDRALIGDDEHGWSDEGIFNFEGGCYAKVIGVREDTEPEIYATTRRFGTVLENVGFDPATRRLDLDDDSLTENTRAAYPVTHIPHVDRGGVAGHPRNILFLTYDAFGVLPPISRLTPEQARYHFISGYTSKVAGTETGITEPQVTFSPCFGAPFMPLPPKLYAGLLAEKIARHKVHCWLVNTGLSGGPYGVGQRMPLAQTRAMVAAVLDGRLADVPMRDHTIFDLQVPQHCPGLEDKLLNARTTWADADDYDRKAKELAERFEKNFAQYV